MDQQNPQTQPNTSTPSTPPTTPFIPAPPSLSEVIQQKNISAPPFSSSVTQETAPSQNPPTPPVVTPKNTPPIYPANSTPPKAPAPIPSVITVPPKPTAIKSESEKVIELETEIVKYSIRTMAQDLERAKKEGVSVIKSPTTPPPPPTHKTTPSTITPPTPVAPPTPKPIIAPTPIVVSTAPKPTFIPTPVTPPTPKPVPPISPAIQTPAPEPVVKRQFFIPPTPTIEKTPPASIIPPTPYVATITKKPSRLSFPHLNIIIGIVTAIILLVGSVGFSYWWFLVKERAPTPPIATPEPKPELPVAPTEPEIPKHLISVDQDIVIEINTQVPAPETTSLIFYKLSSETASLGNKKLGRVLLKYSSSTERKFLSFKDSLSLLGVMTPAELSTELSDGEILAFRQDGKIRYGFAAKTSNSLKTLDTMNAWEDTMISDLSNLFVGTTTTKPEAGTFKDNFYESFVKSYYNFVEPDTSIDWGVSDDKGILILATSRDMIYKIADSTLLFTQ